MTAFDILRSLESDGRRVILEGARVRIHPGVPPEEAERLRPYKSEIIALLRQRSQPPRKECKWPPTLPVCGFLIGHTAEDCKRCGASWLEHYPP